MKVKNIIIRNFKGISDIELEINASTNIIVGPNAVGKTTILEAIRLIKAILVPRYFQETEQVLTSLGAMSPQAQLRSSYFDLSAIARDVSQQVFLSIKLLLEDKEIASIERKEHELALEMLKGRMGRTDDQGRLALTQFLSSEEGNKQLQILKDEVTKRITSLQDKKRLDLSLIIDNNGIIRGKDQFSQVVCLIIEKSLPPHLSLFSYFPADRAFPSGEINIQVGPNEASHQIQSHIGNPAIKYQRLKQSIVNSILLNNVDQSQIKKDFALIFNKLLPGKELHGLSITPMGTLKVSIRENATGKIFDIDSMSSGEKGLILTFLLIKQAIADGGIVLIDEPELHLNPAVCKKLLAFFSDEIIHPKNLQAIICTHSGEVLGSAFDRGDCDIFHLRGHNNATKIYERDHRELFEALWRLGISTADILFSKGNIYVEGEHDASILEEGFYDLLSGFKISSLGGRQEIQKEIANLQKSEKDGTLNKLQCFIFDSDNKPLDLQSTRLVKIIQWDRYCLENFLLDKKILFDQLLLCANNPPDNRGEFERKLKDLALNQKVIYIAKKAYKDFEPENAGIRPKELRGKNFNEIAEILFQRIEAIQQQLQGINKESWIKNFLMKCEDIERSTLEMWEDDWISICNGKELIDALYQEYKIKVSKLEFKKKIIRQMRDERSDSWRIIESKLRELLT